MTNDDSEIASTPRPPASLPDAPREERHSQSWPIPDGVIARLSLEHKLPLLIGMLLLVVITALSAAAYEEVRRTSMRTASERLVNVTTQFRDLFQQSASQLRVQVATIAGKAAVAEFARAPNPRTRAQALAAFATTGPQANQVVATEIRDSTGAVLLSTASPGGTLRVDTMATGDALPASEPTDSAVVGSFRLVRDTLVYPVALAVPGAPNAYVVQWRRLAGSRRSREQITRLIGSEAEMFLGSPAAGRWTNLESVVPPPPLDFTASPVIQQYTHGPGEDRHLAAAMIVPGTPWLVAVGFPVPSIMAPVDSFVRRMAVIAAFALALGLLAAWITSRRITGPLTQLTRAATAIAHGDFAHRVRIRRTDELGRLGAAFAAMAGEVQQSREQLEHKVEERTGALNDTLTQLHDAQDSLVRREKLAMLGQLSSGVGHELRNPLGVMTNAVYYLKAVLAASPANVHEYLDILQQQITLSEKIVSDLLDFARSKPPQRRPTSVPEVTKTQISRLGGLNGVRIETNMPPDLPDVLVDQTQIGQVVLNLLTNAIQAIDGNGAIVVRGQAAGDLVHVDVGDTGPGIPEENLEKIFEPLFTTKARGIGLGLAVSRTLARANNGDLTASSAPGQGATFRLTLQAAPRRQS